MSDEETAALQRLDRGGLPEVSREVEASVERVFDVLAHGWYYASWVVGTSRVRAVDEGFPAVGTRIHHSVGSWPVMLHDYTEVLDADPPHRLALRARGWPAGEAVVDLELLPLGPDRCCVAIREDVVRGPGTLVPLPLRTALVLPRNREALRRLAFLAEGGPDGASGAGRAGASGEARLPGPPSRRSPGSGRPSTPGRPTPSLPADQAEQPAPASQPAVPRRITDGPRRSTGGR